MNIPNATQVDTSGFAPPTATSITLVAKIEPKDGRILIYSSNNIDPVKFNGDGSTHDVPIQEPVIWIQPLDNAKWTISCVGWVDNL